jgi:Ca2+:H+ antiporter
MDLAGSTGHNRMSIYHRLVPGGAPNTTSTHRAQQSLHGKASTVTNLGSNAPSRSQTPLPRHGDQSQPGSLAALPPKPPQPVSPSLTRRVSYATSPTQQPVFAPILESVDHAVKNTGLHNVQLPETMTTDDFTRAVAVATVSALRHQQTQSHSPVRARASGVTGDGEGGGHGGHDAPSWSRTTSASVLLACTALYAVIAGELSLSFLF